MKWVMMTDTQTDWQQVHSLLHQLYNQIYVEHVLKNPLYPLTNTTTPSLMPSVYHQQATAQDSTNRNKNTKGKSVNMKNNANAVSGAGVPTSTDIICETVARDFQHRVDELVKTMPFFA
jgi:hypothetical protein